MSPQHPGLALTNAPRLTEANRGSYQRLDLCQTRSDHVLSFVLRGDVHTRDVASTRWLRAGPGQLMIHAPGRQFIEHATVPGTHCWLGVDGVTQLLPGRSAVIPLVDPVDWIKAFGELVQAHREQPGPARGLRVLAASARLLALVVEGLPSLGGTSSAPVDVVDQALDRDPTAGWTRAVFADLVGVSPAHLDRLFRAATGASVMAYVRRFRLERARQLLRATSLPVAEVGQRCGLPDPAYFGRAYRLYFGVTPGSDRLTPVLQTPADSAA